MVEIKNMVTEPYTLAFVIRDISGIEMNNEVISREAARLASEYHQEVFLKRPDIFRKWRDSGYHTIYLTSKISDGIQEHFNIISKFYSARSIKNSDIGAMSVVLARYNGPKNIIYYNDDEKDFTDISMWILGPDKSVKIYRVLRGFTEYKGINSRK